MKSIDERLADSNPVTQGYVPAAYDQMLTRAMRQSRSRDAAWTTFRLRMAGSVAAASALTVLGVSALNGAGTYLPVLGFQASAAHAGASPTAAAAKSGYGVLGGVMLPVMLNYTFTGAGNFSDAPGAAPVYTMSAPGDLAATLTGVIKVLGVTLDKTPSPATNPSIDYVVNGKKYFASINTSNGSDYWNIYTMPNGVAGVSGTTGAVGVAEPPVTSNSPAASGATGATGATAATGSSGSTGSTGASGATGATGVASGRASSGATGSVGATGPVAATGSLANQAVGYVQALGDTAGSATQSTSGDSTSITVPLLVNGSPSDMSDTFTFNSDGTLQSASGNSFTLSEGATYPLISAAAGVDQINTQQKLLRSLSAFGGPIAYAPVTTTPGVASPAGSAQSLTTPVAVKMSASASGATGASGVSGATGTPGTTGTTTTVVSGATGVTGVNGTTTTIAPLGATAPVTTTVPVTSSGATGATGPSGATGTTGTTTTMSPATRVVDLTAVTTGYGAYDMKSGWMELPVYHYTGTVVDGGYQVSFSVVPLAAQYLDFAPNTNPIPLGAR